MGDIIKKAILTGIGLAAVSKDKIEEITKDMVSKGNMTEQEGRKFVEEMTGYAEKARSDLENRVSGYVEKAVDRMGLVKRSDVEELHAEISELRKRLDQEKEK